MIRILMVSAVLLTASTAEAGRLPGPGKKIECIQGFDLVTYRIKFAPGKPAVVTVLGDGDAALAVGIFDSQDREVKVDVKSTERFELRWTPAGSEPYTIKIKNRGGVPVRFHLKTN